MPITVYRGYNSLFLDARKENLKQEKKNFAKQKFIPQVSDLKIPFKPDSHSESEADSANCLRNNNI